MSSLDQISTDLKLLDSKRENFLKTLQNHQSYPSLTLQWEEFKELSFSIKSSMETFFRELESKENEINDRFKELEVKENESKLRVEDLGLGLTGCSSGKKLFMFLIDHENELEKMTDEVHRILKVSADPTKLVLNAITSGFSLGIERSIVKRCTVLLLEQLMRVGPKSGKRLRKRATKLAKEWKRMMEEGGQDDLEVMGFLMLLGVYGLVCEFDLIEVRSLFESVARQKQAPELRHVLGLVDKSPEGNHSQVQIEQSPLEKNLQLDDQLPSQVKLERYMASSSMSYWPELKSFCIGMDGRGLVLFLCQHVEEHDSMCSAISDALELASDPAKLVLDVLPGFHRSNELFKGLPLHNVRRSCILLLEQLMTVSPQIAPYLNEEALKLAVDWKEKVAQKYPTAVTVYGLLQFIATYRLVSTFDAYELLGLLVRASEHKQSPDLCLALGVSDKIPILIENLLKKPMMLEAMEYICAFELFHEFPPGRILKGHWRYHKKRLYKGKKSHLSQKQMIDREIEIVRAIIKCITGHKLESYCPPEELENYIVELEKQKASGANSTEMLPAPSFKAQLPATDGIKYLQKAVSGEAPLNVQPALQQPEGLYAHQAAPCLSSFSGNHNSGRSAYVGPDIGSFTGTFRVASPTLFQPYTSSLYGQHGSGITADWSGGQFSFPGTHFGMYDGSANWSTPYD